MTYQISVDPLECAKNICFIYSKKLPCSMFIFGNIFLNYFSKFDRTFKQDNGFAVRL